MRRPSLPVGRKVPIIFLVIIPAIAITYAFYTTIPTPNQIVIILDSHHFRIIITVTIYTGLIYYTSLGPHCIVKGLKQGHKQALDELKTVRNVIPIILPLTVIILVVFNWPQPTGGSYETNYPKEAFTVMGLFVVSTALSCLLVYSLTVLRKESRFYISKSYFITALGKKDIFTQMRYFGIGLEEYNKYLIRRLRYQIKDIDKVFSKVSLLDNNTKTEVIRTLSNSFETEMDKLKPLRCISSELMKSEDTGSLLVPESLKSRLKTVGVFLAAVIPIVVSIISLLLTLTTKAFH